MANDRLRTAMLAAGLNVDSLATALRRDRKTVERWISQEHRQPHRETRVALARLLKVREVDLWPELGGLPRPAAVESELVHLYPSRSAITGANWTELLTRVSGSMDVLVFSGAFLVEQYDLIPLIRKKAANGVRFRILVGDETSDAVKQRAIDEGTPGGLEGRIQLMRRYLSDVVELEGVEVRTHSTVLYNSIYRFDDDLLVNGHAHGALAGQSPVLHLHKVPNGQMWDHYMKSFELTWKNANPETGMKG